MTGSTAGDRPLPGSDVPLAAVHDTVLLDLDGTVYLGLTPIDGAVEVVAALREMGLTCCFLTNNAYRSAAATAEVLRDMGVPAEAADVVTSAQAAARLLGATLAPGAGVLVIGGDGLHAALREEGLRPVRSVDDDPVAVVQGFAPDVDWRQLAEGVFAVRRGLPWVATNLDLTLPTPRGEAPGNGSLVAVVRLATGVEPRVAGKPEPPLVEAALARTAATNPLVVGDRLDTDIAGAVNVDLPSLLVLTGVTDVDLLLAAPPEQRPTHISPDMHGLLVAHPGVQRAAEDRWTCGAWTATIRSGALDVARRVWGVGAEQDPGPMAGSRAWPDAYDGLRAACAAAWRARDEGIPVDVGGARAALGL